MKISDPCVPFQSGQECRLRSSFEDLPRGLVGRVVDALARPCPQHGSCMLVDFGPERGERRVPHVFAVMLGDVARLGAAAIPFSALPSLEDSDASAWCHEHQVQVATMTRGLRRSLQDWGVDLADPEMERLAKALAVAAAREIRRDLDARGWLPRGEVVD